MHFRLDCCFMEKFSTVMSINVYKWRWDDVGRTLDLDLDDQCKVVGVENAGQSTQLGLHIHLHKMGQHHQLLQQSSTFSTLCIISFMPHLVAISDEGKTMSVTVTTHNDDCNTRL